MVSQRRYNGYRYEDVLVYLAQHVPLPFEDSKGRGDLRFEGLVNLGRCVQVRYRDKTYQAVVLARASDWYRYSLNCTERWHHHVSAAIVGTHDSCLPVPVFAIDEQRAYEKRKARVEDFTGPGFDEALRKTAYGHRMLLGGLMCLRVDAQARLAQLPLSTQRRIRAEVKRLHLRRRGRPLPVV
jgi:hypothetical protein